MTAERPLTRPDRIVYLSLPRDRGGGARHLGGYDTEPITDPWVRERVTLCATESDGMLAVVHLLRYGNDPEVGPAYRGVGEISWLTDLQVRESWRNRGIGRWLVRHAVQWLRLAGCERRADASVEAEVLVS